MRITGRTRKQIAAEAVDWFLQFREAAGTEPDRHSFSEWLLRSPAHVEEYLRVSCSWCAANVGADGDLQTGELVAAAKRHHEADNVVALPRQFGQRPPYTGRDPGPSLLSRRTALAASLVLGVTLWVGYESWHLPMIFQTVVGEQSSFTLQDGSVLFLNTNSKVRIRWLPNERHVELVRGEARFKVAKDASRPFTVGTTTAAVRAVGTVFNVRAEPLTTQVAVLEGRVEVTVALAAAESAAAVVPFAAASAGTAAAPSHPMARVQLAAGERAAVTPEGIETDSGPPIESVRAWTERRLVFRDQPLNTVIREFNRYRISPLVLDDPALAALRISGVFDLNDPESLIAYLGTFETVRVDRHSDGSQHLFRGPAGSDARK
jgi:transmembrane sensor